MKAPTSFGKPNMAAVRAALRADQTRPEDDEDDREDFEEEDEDREAHAEEDDEDREDREDHAEEDEDREDKAENDDEEKKPEARRARARERRRIAAILGSSAAAGREELAAHFAFNTGLSAAAVRAALKSAPRATARAGLGARMGAYPNAKVGPGSSSADSDAVARLRRGASLAFGPQLSPKKGQ